MRDLILEVKRILLGKEETCEKIVIGVDPGAAIGLAVIADGKIIEGKQLLSGARKNYSISTEFLRLLETSTSP